MMLNLILKKILMEDDKNKRIDDVKKEGLCLSIKLFCSSTFIKCCLNMNLQILRFIFTFYLSSSLF